MVKQNLNKRRIRTRNKKTRSRNSLRTKQRKLNRTKQRKLKRSNKNIYIKKIYRTKKKELQGGSIFTKSFSKLKDSLKNSFKKKLPEVVTSELKPTYPELAEMGDPVKRAEKYVREMIECEGDPDAKNKMKCLNKMSIKDPNILIKVLKEKGTNEIASILKLLFEKIDDETVWVEILENVLKETDKNELPSMLKLLFEKLDDETLKNNLLSLNTLREILLENSEKMDEIELLYKLLSITDDNTLKLKIFKLYGEVFDYKVINFYNPEAASGQFILPSKIMNHDEIERIFKDIPAADVIAPGLKGESLEELKEEIDETLVIFSNDFYNTNKNYEVFQSLLSIIVNKIIYISLSEENLYIIRTGQFYFIIEILQKIEKEIKDYRYQDVLNLDSEEILSSLIVNVLGEFFVHFRNILGYTTKNPYIYYSDGVICTTSLNSVKISEEPDCEITKKSLDYFYRGYDEDRNAKLEKFREVWNTFDQQRTNQLKKEYVVKVIELIDGRTKHIIDQNGIITFEDFIQWCEDYKLDNFPLPEGCIRMIPYKYKQKQLQLIMNTKLRDKTLQYIQTFCNSQKKTPIITWFEITNDTVKKVIELIHTLFIIKNILDKYIDEEEKVIEDIPENVNNNPILTDLSTHVIPDITPAAASETGKASEVPEVSQPRSEDTHDRWLREKEEAEEREQAEMQKLRDSMPARRAEQAKNKAMDLKVREALEEKKREDAIIAFRKEYPFVEPTSRTRRNHFVYAIGNAPDEKARLGQVRPAAAAAAGGGGDGVFSPSKKTDICKLNENKFFDEKTGKLNDNKFFDEKTGSKNDTELNQNLDKLKSSHKRICALFEELNIFFKISDFKSTEESHEAMDAQTDMLTDMLTEKTQEQWEKFRRTEEKASRRRSGAIKLTKNQIEREKEIRELKLPSSATDKQVKGKKKSIKKAKQVQEDFEAWREGKTNSKSRLQKLNINLRRRRGGNRRIKTRRRKTRRKTNRRKTNRRKNKQRTNKKNKRTYRK